MACTITGPDTTHQPLAALFPKIPSVLAAALTSSSYVLGDPTNLTDPSGHSPGVAVAAVTVGTEAGLGSTFGAEAAAGSAAGPVGAVVAAGAAAGVYDYYKGREYCTAAGWSWCSNPSTPQLGPLPVNPPGTSRGPWPKHPDMAGRKPAEPGNGTTGMTTTESHCISCVPRHFWDSAESSMP